MFGDQEYESRVGTPITVSAKLSEHGAFECFSFAVSLAVSNTLARSSSRVGWM